MDKFSDNYSHKIANEVVLKLKDYSETHMKFSKRQTNATLLTLKLELMQVLIRYCELTNLSL